LSENNFKLGVLVVAYNAASTIERTLNRIPSEMQQKISAILVSDDSSPDDTYEIVKEYARKSHLPIETVKQEKNLGYGGNQKFGYQWAINKGLDAVVMLHADGQYAPEQMYKLVEPLKQDLADAVFGSRMMIKGAARRGGMPLYKYFGNKILTRTQNFLTKEDFSEWHSGYRAYKISALMKLDFENLNNGFRFDTQIILGLLSFKQRIKEVPIPTFYGDEVSHVNGILYAAEIIWDTLKFRLRHK
jgi:glycosyltransferase involved in cell wall biosynthesis